MKYLLIFLSLIPICSYAKTVRVRAHITRKGHYVAPSTRTSPDHTRLDNWSTQGNTNPATGKLGRKRAY